MPEKRAKRPSKRLRELRGRHEGLCDWLDRIETERDRIKYVLSVLDDEIRRLDPPDTTNRVIFYPDSRGNH